MTYEEAIQFLYDLRMFGTKLGLENTFKLAELCGNPHRDLRFIHVAGTNGKGSTCAMLESIYRGAGYRTGFFTSPHLVSFTERIQVCRRPIPQAEVVRLVEQILSVVREENANAPQHLWTFRPTFFEFVAVMALLYFVEQKCELILWETGMGGRLDATNIVHPLASVITNIQYDHEKWLGETIPQIAAEKAGIIKEGVPLITAATDPEALQVIRSTSRRLNAPLAEINSDSLAHPFIAKMTLSLEGDHQRWNAAVALATVQTLRHILPVSDDHIITGFDSVRWPGRFQRLQFGETTVILDGAHNPAGAEMLAQTLRHEYPRTPVTLVLGLFKDKQWERMCQILLPLASTVYLVPVQSERTADPAVVRDACSVHNPNTQVIPSTSLADALNSALKEKLVVVAGSLHLVGEAMEHLGITAGAPSERALNEWDATNSTNQNRIARVPPPG